jgi:hypothetical protein
MWPSTAFITTMRRGSTPHFRWRGVSDWTGLIELTCLDLGTVLVLHLPGEPFMHKSQCLRVKVARIRILANARRLLCA